MAKACWNLGEFSFVVHYETEGDYSTNKIVHRSRGFGVYSNGSSPSRDSVTMVVIRKNINNVIDAEAITLFNDLTSRYPMAAAGLIHDLCDKLSFLLESESSDEHAIENLCETLSQIFRPIDQRQFPESYPWDAAYDRFGRRLMRGLPRNRDAVIAITGWSNEQMAACKTRYTEMVRIYRDDWNRAANTLENKIIE